MLIIIVSGRLIPLRYATVSSGDAAKNKRRQRNKPNEEEGRGGSSSWGTRRRRKTNLKNPNRTRKGNPDFF